MHVTIAISCHYCEVNDVYFLLRAHEREKTKNRTQEENASPPLLLFCRTPSSLRHAKNSCAFGRLNREARKHADISLAIVYAGYFYLAEATNPPNIYFRDTECVKCG